MNQTQKGSFALLLLVLLFGTPFAFSVMGVVQQQFVAGWYSSIATIAIAVYLNDVVDKK